MDKTVKMRAYSGDVNNPASQGNLSDDQNKTLALINKNAQLEEENKKALEHLKTIEHLKESLRQEQAKMAEMVKKAAGQNSNEIAVRDAQLEEEKSRSLEHLRTIVQLRESLKQEQFKTGEMAIKMSVLEAKVKDAATLEANALAKNNAELGAEKSKSSESLKTIEQLKESLKQEQAKTAEMAAKATEMAGKIKESAALEAKVTELTETLGKISNIAAMMKAV